MVALFVKNVKAICVNMTDVPLGYSGLNACTSVPDNSSYMGNVHYAAMGTPMDGSTMALLMVLSTFQYQAPYIDATYSNALSQASKAAYIESGGQAFQDRLFGVVTKDGEDVARTITRFMGITDMEAVVVVGAARVIKDRQLDINGPKICTVKTHLTLTPDSGIVGIKYDW